MASCWPKLLYTRKHVACVDGPTLGAGVHTDAGMVTTLAWPNVGVAGGCQQGSAHVAASCLLQLDLDVVAEVGLRILKIFCGDALEQKVAWGRDCDGQAFSDNY